MGNPMPPGQGGYVPGQSNPYHGQVNPQQSPPPPYLGQPHPYGAPPPGVPAAAPPVLGYGPASRPASGGAMERVAGGLLLVAALLAIVFRLANAFSSSYRFLWSDVMLALMILLAILTGICALAGMGARYPVLRALAAVAAGMLLSGMVEAVLGAAQFEFLFEDTYWLSIPCALAAFAATLATVVAAAARTAPAPRGPVPHQYPPQNQPPR
ncbi:hypothetical protein APR11_005104 [Nocardia amikacinitolerans]|uniref:hypothetical protein n=1 Tax=Nocardia amikacinitolerans TaxID=756689 RepID=UPI0020A32ADA|nr:hypothetical protein [Nocardia amikacinitolerans]MCP2298656.1 hypothetical protein [Nocardia amikacinitolerans]